MRANGGDGYGGGSGRYCETLLPADPFGLVNGDTYAPGAGGGV